MRGERRYGFGVEALAGLVAGASALAVLVVFMVLFLMLGEHRRWSASLATGAAARIAEEMGANPDQQGFEDACRGLLPTDALAGAMITDVSGTPLYSFPEVELDELSSDRWVFIPMRGGGSIGVLMAESQTDALGKPLLAGLGVISIALALTAFMMPGYLRQRVIDPLRKLLLQADSYRSGGGQNPGAASVSFHELVKLLSDKERELDSLREQAVARAELAESRAGAALESLDSAVAAMDSEGRLLLWNARASDLYGLVETDRGLPFPFERTPLCSAGESPTGEVEYKGRAYRVKRLSHSGGELLITATDISDILSLERRLSEERSLADLGAFSGGVVHEIGNTLCAIRGFLDLLGRGVTDARSAGLINEARLELDAASRVVDAFRTLARSEGPEFALVSRGEIECCIRRECEGLGVSFSTAGEGDGAYRTDVVLLARCVKNLLDNALDKCRKEQVSVAISGLDPLVIEVADMGPGLPDPPELVFRPLYSTGRENGHMGIGLTVSRRIVLAMGGRIVPRNTGRGASFLISLPREGLA